MQRRASRKDETNAIWIAASCNVWEASQSQVSKAYIMNVSITLQGIVKVYHGDFPLGMIARQSWPWRRLLM